MNQRKSAYPISENLRVKNVILPADLGDLYADFHRLKKRLKAYCLQPKA
ncbi:hypothetical protein VB264_08240 [Arcicella aquatica]|uniref:Uncharacterized protein n=1 Tax=Arcicella aquatica TaxID=217141 RepID=A0ABU5QL32_9BACT|nr:hypothetical protein [Arcicella aquatica]MEA5257771.1 hypothetical protein [Arcicella aquatica]